MRRLAAIVVVAAASLGVATAAQAAALVPVPGDWSSPIYAASPPRDPSRLFVVQRGGLVRVVVDGTLRSVPFADLTGQVGLDGERGLLSIAFPSDYETSGLAHVYLAAPDGELQIRELRRSAANPDVSDGTQRIVWRQAHDEAANHDGGTIAFGPDGMLWFATGDGGGGCGSRSAPMSRWRCGSRAACAGWRDSGPPGGSCRPRGGSWSPSGSRRRRPAGCAGRCGASA